MALQAALAVGSLVPILAGGAGVIHGVATGLDGLGIGGISMDSHFRYLSGLLLAIGLGYACAIPRIEKHARTVRLLTALVVIGGFGRVVGLITNGVPSPWMLAALGMELGVAPLLAFWQAGLLRRAGFAR